MRIKTWVNEKVESFVRTKWPEKSKRIKCSYNNDSSKVADWNRWIQIPTPIDDEWIHYEIIMDHIELHFENSGQNNSGIKANQELINYLEQITESNENYEWLDFQEGSSLSCKYVISFVYADDIDNMLSSLEEIINYFDPLIKDFIQKNQLTSSISIKNLPPSTNEKVDLYQFVLREVYELDLHIPDYQRIYCWDENNVRCMLNDLSAHSFPDQKNICYRLGTIILHYHNQKYDIIDGQQRLVTLALLLETLGVSTCLLNERFESSEAKEYIRYNKYLVDDFVRKHITDRNKLINSLLEYVDFSILILQNSSLDIAYTFFSNENSRGVALTDYDLLKAHHLRFIPDSLEKQSEKVAKNWNIMIENGRHQTNTENRIPDYVRTLDTCLYHIRRWMRKENPELYPEDRHIKSEYQAAPTMPDLPPFGEKFEFKEPIQGGTHFFYFVEAYLVKYKQFIKTKEYQVFQANMPDYGSFKWYRNAIEALTFGYYEKFGEQCLADALILIIKYLLQQRYNTNRALKSSIYKYVAEGGVILMIDQATSPTFFLAELYNICREFPFKYLQDMQPIQKNMRSSLLAIRKELIPRVFVESIKKIKL